MKTIPLSGKRGEGKFAIVDDWWYDELVKHKWQLSCCGYASRWELTNGSRREIFMHHVVCETPIGLQVDHIYRIKLDNRESELRICTNMENSRNRGLRSDNTTGFKGVTYHRSTGKFLARVRYDGKCSYLGLFNTAEEAHGAYVNEVIKHHGEFAWIS